MSSPLNKNEQILTLIKLGIDNLNAAAGGGGGGLAQEATLQSILNNMMASQDVEILLVRDTGAANVVVQQIREYDQGTGVWTTRYEDVNGVAYVPVGPLVYLDPSAVLSLILAEVSGMSTRDTNVVIATGVGSVPAGSLRGSIYNLGPGTAVWKGATIPAGVGVPWGSANNNDTFVAHAYDASGTTLVIEYDT